MTASAISDTVRELLELFHQSRYRELIDRAATLQIDIQTQPLETRLMAAAHFQLGDYATALPLLERLEASMAQDAEYLGLYGATCRRLGLLDRAKEILARAREISPQSPSVRNNYANVLIDLNQVEEARAILEQLLEENPAYGDARVNLNRIRYRESQANSQPLSTAQRWKPLDPLMRAFAQDEVTPTTPVPGAKPGPDPVASQLAAAIPEVPAQQLGFEQLQLAGKAVAEGQHTFALDLCSQALAALPQGTAAAYSTAADAYLGLQRWREAETCLLHALSLGGASVATCVNLASLARMRNDISLAQHYLEQAAGLDPSHPMLKDARQQLEQQRGSATRPYRFDAAWADSTLTPVNTQERALG